MANLIGAAATMLRPTTLLVPPGLEQAAIDLMNDEAEMAANPLYMFDDRGIQLAPGNLYPTDNTLARAARRAQEAMAAQVFMNIANNDVNINYNPNLGGAQTFTIAGGGGGIGLGGAGAGTYSFSPPELPTAPYLGKHTPDAQELKGFGELLKERIK